MAKLTLIHGSPAPDTPAEKVRRKLRATRSKLQPSCSTCGGHEYVTARAGKTATKLCVICLLQGRRREMDTPA